MVRVLFLSRVLPDEQDSVKGIFVLDQARTLMPDCEVAVVRVSRLGLRSRRRPVNGESYTHVSGPPAITDIWFRTVRRYGATITLALAVQAYFRRHGKPDLVHLHFSRGLRGAAVAARMSGIPVVVTEHGGPWPGAEASSRVLREPRKTLNAAALVLPVSAWLERTLRDKGVRARMRVVPNAVDPAIFSYARPHSRSPAGPRQIIQVARLDGFDKGVADVIRAVARLRATGVDVELNVIGDGPERQPLEKCAGKSGVSDHVHFLGTKTRAEIAQLHRGSDLLVSATRGYETFGVAVAEALACGLPVVATDVGAISELVTDGLSGYLVPEGDHGALVDGLRRALFSDWDREAIASDAARLRPDAVKELLLDSYAQVLNPL